MYGTRSRKVLGTGMVALVVLGSAAAGCRRPPARAVARTLRIAHETHVQTLDPTLLENTTFSALSNVFEPLVTYDPRMRLVPCLASRWNAVDETTWDLELRPGVRFHDGSPLRATDVKAALDRARTDPESTAGGALWAVIGVEAPDERRIRIRTGSPNALLLHELTQILVPRGGNRKEIEAHPVGTGAYRVVRWEKNGSLELEAFPEYRGGPPPISRVSIVAAEEGRESLDALTHGRVDVASIPPRTPVDVGLPFRVAVTPGLTTHYLWISSLPTRGRTNPFSDPRVRRAVSLAIDRRAIARSETGSEGTAAGQMVPPTVFGYAPDLPPPSHDVALARRLLAEAGHAAGFDTVLTHRSSEAGARVASLAAGMLREAGIRVTLRPVSWDTLLEESLGQHLPLSLGRWTFDNGDAGAFLRDCLHSRGTHPGEGLFNPGYASAAADRLVDGIGSDLIDATRLARFEEVMRLERDEAPFVPLYHQPDVYGVRPGIRWEPRIDGRILAAEFSFEP